MIGLLHGRVVAGEGNDRRSRLTGVVRPKEVALEGGAFARFLHGLAGVLEECGRSPEALPLMPPRRQKLGVVEIAATEEVSRPVVLTSAHVGFSGAHRMSGCL